MSKNIHVQNITITIPGKTLIHNSNLSLTYGSKYGLIGVNGSGKTTLLKHIYKKELSIPPNFPVYYVGQEDEKVDNNKTVYQVVLEANKDKYELVSRLNELEEILDTSEDEKVLDEYNKITEKLDQLQYYKDEAMIRKILYGLGFPQEQQNALYYDQSGGYKMRVLLCKGLYMNPMLLLLDEVVNHLDLSSVIFLVDYLTHKWKNTILMVSHDTNFLNEICTHIIHLDNQQLNYHVGNYDNFLKTQAQEQATKEKEWKVIENKIKEMKRASTKKEIVDEFYEKNKDKEPPKPYKVNIRFNQTNKLNNPLIELSHVTFGYSNDKILFDDLKFTLCNGDKYVLAGKNGVGKTTLLKLLAKRLKPINDHSEIIHNNRLKFGVYEQEFNEIEANLQLTPVEYLKTIDTNLNEFQARKLLGIICLDSTNHMKQMALLSGGEKAKVQMVAISVNKPHVLLLDEPTNHFDVQNIDSIIQAIKEYTGAMVIITHNIAFIEETGCKILLLENQKLIELDFNEYYDKILGDIENFSL